MSVGVDGVWVDLLVCLINLIVLPSCDKQEISYICGVVISTSTYKSAALGSNPGPRSSTRSSASRSSTLAGCSLSVRQGNCGSLNMSRADGFSSTTASGVSETEMSTEAVSSCKLCGAPVSEAQSVKFSFKS